MAEENLTILAIDDHADNLITLKAILRETFPLSVILLANSGEEGIALALDKDPDVILTDIVMPGMDGFELCRTLKQMDMTRDIPVVFITALKGDREHRINALEVGADGFLAKPIDETELTAQITAMSKLKKAAVRKRDEKKRFETMLHARTRELEQRNIFIQTVLDNLPMGLAINEIEKGSAIYMNRKFEEIYGWPQSDLINIPQFFRNVYPNDAYREELMARVMDDVNSMDPARMHWENCQITHKDGSRHVINAVNIPLPDQNIMVSTVVDVTEQKRAEKIHEIQYQVVKATLAAKSLQDFLWLIKNELSSLVETSNFFMAFYDEATQIFRKELWLDEKDDFPEWHASQSLSGQVVRQRRTLLLKKTGIQSLKEAGKLALVGTPAECWLGVPVMIQEDIIGVIVIQSYTDPNAYDKSIANLMEIIAHEVGLYIGNRMDEENLIRAKEKAEESDRLKSAFLANMSHEIRTPMNAIVGFAQLLSDPELTDDDREKFTSIIKQRSDDLLHIVSDILDISRIESGNATAVKTRVNLNSIIGEMEMVTLQKLQRSNRNNLRIFCDKSLPDGETFFISDPYILRQVFTNLIDNAIKFTPEGTIRIGYHKPGNGMVTCYVTDTGIGIKQQNLEVIFKHFRQADIENQQQYGGTGLGLAICRGALTLINGSISVVSEPGKGSTFSFEVPFFQENPASDPTVRNDNAVVTAPSPKTTPDWSGKKILLVEDEASNMEFLRIILNRTKAELFQATCGKELRMYYPQLAKIDLVLLDVRLPDANGWDLAMEIKKIRPDLPVIAQTAYAMSTDRKKSQQSGCDDYIPKPISRELLINIISKRINKPDIP